MSIKSTKRQDTLGFLLADVSRLMRRAFQQRLQGCELTLAQARTLVYISRHQGIRQVELAELLEIQPITLARLIDQLQANGLVERRSDPLDRRAYRLFLTSSAAPQLDAIERVGETIRSDALRGLSDNEAAQVMAALRRMHDNLGAA
jgi:DNA-binding MarR family transcriptional regulator